MDGFPRVIVFAIAVVVITQSAVVLIVVATLLHGLFDDKVDNRQIFAVVGPAFIATVGSFGTIMGALAGFIAGRAERAKVEAA